MKIDDIYALEHRIMKLIGWQRENPGDVRFFTPHAYELVYKTILDGLEV